MHQAAIADGLLLSAVFATEMHLADSRCSGHAVICSQAEAQEYLASCDCPDYLRKAEKRLAEEVERVRNYMDPGSEAKITRVVETELVQKQVGLSRSWGTDVPKPHPYLADYCTYLLHLGVSQYSCRAMQHVSCRV